VYPESAGLAEMWFSVKSLGEGSRGCRASEDAFKTTGVGPGTDGRGEGEEASDTVRGQNSKDGNREE